MSRQMHLGILANPHGMHSAAWLHPSTQADAATNIDFHKKVVRTAEAGKFDLFFLADTPAARTSNLEAWSRFPMYMDILEPTVLLSALAGATSHIGLGATASTSFTEPYNVARQFASLDHVSGGRAAWNVVTSANSYVALNFGHDRLPPHEERYERAAEYVEIVKQLWDTWEEGAVVLDRAEGIYFDRSRFHPMEFKGKHLSVKGALNISRTPQGRPVILQAGQSGAGMQLAAATADVVFASGDTLEKAQTFYRTLRTEAEKAGRDPDSVKILSGLNLMLGRTRAEAEDRAAELQALVHPAVSVQFLSEDLEIDLSGLPLDEPVPEELIPASANMHKVYFQTIVDRMRNEKPTLRQLAAGYNRNRNTFTGTARDCADLMEHWFKSDAADGFMIMYQVLPGLLEEFVRDVVPELQRRGVFRREYTGRTLRDHFGLPAPANRHSR